MSTVKADALRLLGEWRQRGSLASLASYAAPVGLVVVWLVFFIATPNFLTTANISDLLVASAILTVLALGQQLVVVIGGIDLSVGANLPWAAAVLGYGTQHGWGMAVSILAGVAAATVVGIVNGFFVAVLGVTDFVATLGSLSVVSGITLLLTSGNTVPVSSHFLQSMALGGIGPIHYFWVIAMVLAFAVAALLFRLRIGTHLLATGGSLDATRGVGISITRTRLFAYAASGLLCGVAGVMFVARNGGVDPSLQTDLLLSSIAAVVLGGSSLNGGRASVTGTVAGAILLTSLVNGFTLLGISQYYQPIANGAVVWFAAMLVRWRK